MTAELNYLSLLYEELTRKLKTVHLYIDAVDSQVGDIYENVYKGVEVCKSKYELLQNYEKASPTVRPDMDFAMESSVKQKNEDTTGDDVQKSMEDITEELKGIFTEINFRFSKQQKNLTMLTAAHEDLQTLINSVFEQWRVLNKETQ